MFNRLLVILLLSPCWLYGSLLHAETGLPNASTEEVVTLDTRPGVKQSFLLLQPQSTIKAVVLLFPGHTGAVHFAKGPDGYDIKHEGGGLTVRKELWDTYLRKGIVVAILASPSDMASGMDTDFRSSDKHLEDVRHVLDFLTEKYGQKVYLHGHCRSTFSPSSITTKLKNEGIAGIILSSPRSTGKYGAVMDYEAGVITVPVLLVQHKDDPCNGTPYSNPGSVKAFYEKSSKKMDVIVVSGGNMKVTGPKSCQAGPHSFSGMEDETSIAIANWILGKEFSRSINGPMRY